MTTIAVIGATGGIGRHVVSLALQDGHTVRALARTPSKLPEHPQLTVVQGSVLDLEPVQEVVTGAEMVLSCLGTVRGESPVVTQGTRMIVSAMQRADVARLAMVSSIGVGDSEAQGKRASRLFMHVIVPLFLREQFYELATAEEAARVLPQAVVVRPTGLSNKPLTGQYRVTDANDRVVNMSVRRADVARFMVDLIQNTEHDGTSVSLFSV